MNRWAGLALFVLMAALFLVANRGAYKGYFQDDELDNISWAPQVPLSEFGKTLITPRYLHQNFRPVGHFYFHEAGKHFGLDFPRYVFFIHLLHFLNVWLVWLLARRLGASPFAASTGALFFAFHMAAFDVYWKPMYVFDLLCGSFWLGQKRWKPLVPFFAAALSFGLQGLLLNPNRDNDYTFRFTPRALATTVPFYAGKIFLIPYGGLALPLVPLVLRERRVWLCLAATLLFFVPLAFLPGRMFSAYCYVPLIGVALLLAVATDRAPRMAMAAFFVLWIPWNYAHLRLYRRQALAIADQNRRYVTALEALARSEPAVRTFVYDGRPDALNVWGIHGALQYLYRRFDLRLVNIEDPGAEAALQENAVAVLSWDPLKSRLSTIARRPGAPDASFIRMDSSTPLWQLEQGWYPLEAGYRWTQPVATARLFRPAEANEFELTVNIGPDVIRDLGRIGVHVLVNGQLLGSHEFTRNGWQTVRWPLPPGKAGTAQVEMRVEPGYRPSNRDPRALGLAVGSFGFSTKETM